MKCNICPRKCDVDRSVGVGFCQAPEDIKIAKYMLHKWEEPIISGENGSGAIFFSHCNLKCVYCQNEDISSGGKGECVSVDKLVEIFKKLEDMGANNINLVTPTHYTEHIINALDIYRPNIPIVWNSSGYEDEEVVHKLRNYVDIYLVDMKYMDEGLAFNLSKAKDYPQICAKAILEMRKNQPKDIIVNGLMQKGVIIRHLVLPNEVENTFKVLGWINEHLGANTYISIMGQYTPCYKAKDMPKYNRTLHNIEYKRVLNKINALGFNNGFIQDLNSASDSFIPDFNKFED